MKHILKWGVLFLAIVALLPFTAGIKDLNINKQRRSEAGVNTIISPASEDEIIYNSEFSEKEKEIIIAKVMEHITENSHTETKKAMIAICKNNYLYLKNQGETNFKTDISKYSDEFLSELITLFNEEEYTISYKGRLVAIPMVPQNGGFTSTNDEYPYIESVASPWDTFSSSYIRGGIYPCGVSIYGINYLCENGMSYKESLLWYLPGFDIN